jgi:hypothetical protein
MRRRDGAMSGPIENSLFQDIREGGWVMKQYEKK